MPNEIAVDCNGSNCLSDATYEPDSETLTVTYRGTQSQYRYSGISMTEANEFLSSNSKGHSLTGIIEGKAYEQM